MKTCENCGGRVYNLGCVNCDEEAYIAEQEMINDRIERESQEYIAFPPEPGQEQP